ncbi:MAG: ATP-dependent DNA ligase [Burkholderiaceae bacterium]
MQAFARLYEELDQSTATLDKLAAMKRYFAQADGRDAAWALHILRGGKINTGKHRLASSTELLQWAAEACALPLWAIQASYHQVGDLAETLALLMQPEDRAEIPPPAATPQQPTTPEAPAIPKPPAIPEPPAIPGPPAAPEAPAPPDDGTLADWVEAFLQPLAGQPSELRRAAVVAAWRKLPFMARLVFNKLLTGALRVGVSQRLVQQALAEHGGIDVARIAQRMMGHWQPDTEFFERLLLPAADDGDSAGDAAQPYPFYLASPLEQPPQALGDITQWQIEWKWDGIRLQIIRRAGLPPLLWSRGEERLDGRFPELEQAALGLPEGTVLDAELLAWQAGADAPLAFIHLQPRIQRRKPSPRLIADAPARALVYDLLEFGGVDWRTRTLDERRACLERMLGELGDARLQMSPRLPAASWEQAAELRRGARERGTEGLMLKRLGSAYLSGRRRGDWWKWKIEPLTIDAVLIYAQTGHGRRSTLHTDYTFALWDGDALVPVAKAYSGLTDAEIDRLDRWIRAHTLQRFGPVRAVEPFWVFELAFEAVNLSKRHKSGVAVRFPRILRWREDKLAADADRLDALKALAMPREAGV